MRFILTLLLAIVCTPAWAEWVKMGEADKSTLFFMTSATAYYIDPGSVTRNGDLRKVWEIHDLRDKGPKGERSILTSVEYDCAAKQMRTVSETGRSQRMARGLEVFQKQVQTST